MPVTRARRDPSSEYLPLLGWQRFVTLRRWPHLICIGRVDPGPDGALLQITRHDRDGSTGSLSVSALRRIQTQLRLPLLHIRPVTRETFVGKNRTHIAVEVDFLCGKCPRRQNEEHRDAETLAGLVRGHGHAELDERHGSRMSLPYNASNHASERAVFSLLVLFSKCRRWANGLEGET